MGKMSFFVETDWNWNTICLSPMRDDPFFSLTPPSTAGASLEGQIGVGSAPRSELHPRVGGPAKRLSPDPSVAFCTAHHYPEG